MSTKVKEIPNLLWKKQFTEEQLDLWGEDLAEEMIDYYHDMVKRGVDPSVSLSCIEKIKDYYKIE